MDLNAPNRVQIRAQQMPWHSGVGLLIGSPDGKTVVEQIVFKRLSEQDTGVDPRQSMELTPTQAQTLMDDLWQCGIRPTEGTGSAGSLAATERHLEDMRKIAFAKLDGLFTRTTTHAAP